MLPACRPSCSSGVPLIPLIFIAEDFAKQIRRYDQGVLSGLLENEHFRGQFGNPNDVITGITVASYCLGAFVGCGINFGIGDIFGRRRMIWLAMGFIIIGASLQTSAYSLAHLIVGRVITGLGTGIDSSTVPMYQSELSKREWRGRLVSWEILFIGIGITLAYWVLVAAPGMLPRVVWLT